MAKDDLSKTPCMVRKVIIYLNNIKTCSKNSNKIKIVKLDF